MHSAPTLFHTHVTTGFPWFFTFICFSKHSVNFILKFFFLSQHCPILILHIIPSSVPLWSHFLLYFFSMKPFILFVHLTQIPTKIFIHSPFYFLQTRFTLLLQFMYSHFLISFTCSGTFLRLVFTYVSLLFNCFFDLICPSCILFLFLTFITLCQALALHHPVSYNFSICQHFCSYPIYALWFPTLRIFSHLYKFLCFDVTLLIIQLVPSVLRIHAFQHIQYFFNSILHIHNFLKNIKSSSAVWP